MGRVSVDDLAFAAEWMDAYEAAPDEDDNDAKAARVSAWLRAEVERRQKEAFVRHAAKRHGMPISKVRKAVSAYRAVAN